jgi:hypothetical protein
MFFRIRPTRVLLVGLLLAASSLVLKDWGGLPMNQLTEYTLAHTLGADPECGIDFDRYCDQYMIDTAFPTSGDRSCHGCSSADADGEDFVMCLCCENGNLANWSFDCLEGRYNPPGVDSMNPHLMDCGELFFGRCTRNTIGLVICSASFPTSTMCNAVTEYWQQ